MGTEKPLNLIYLNFVVDFISWCTLPHMSFQYRSAQSLLLLLFQIRVPSCVYLYGLNCFPLFPHVNYRDYINQMKGSEITSLWAYHNSISASHIDKFTKTKKNNAKRPIWNIKTTHGNIKFVREFFECESADLITRTQAHFWIISVLLLLLLLLLAVVLVVAFCHSIDKMIW